jgi:NAD(P)-dependent dehydrogenase (short-subunit alcohol dehydrogenase family)
MSEVVRVAVVTGGNRGMGLETCRQLAQRGLRVVLTSRDVEKGKAAVAELSAAGLEVEFHPLDVTRDESVAALVAYLEERHGRLDVLVNNAGAAFEPFGSSFFDASLETVRKSFEVNTLGAVRCCRALVPLMKRNGYGRVVNVSSGMGQLSDMNGGSPGYRISKAGLNALTKLLSDELADSHIKVNAVCPGHVKTDMGGPHASRTVEEGVDTTVWLATLRDDGPTGSFFRDCKAIPW